MISALTFGNPQPLQHSRSDQYAQDAAHDTHTATRLRSPPRFAVAGVARASETAGCKARLLRRNADGVAEGWVAEEEAIEMTRLGIMMDRN
jgi:hypothetical protein